MNIIYYLYKITNIITNDMYIGKTINPIAKRFHRHINDAISNRLDTHLARAIRYYKPDNFRIEQIDTANTIDELNIKEKYWIAKYDTYNNGYNETEGGDGGNTYSKKTKEEMNIIKEKLHQSKLGGKNPQARKIKIKNINTNEELHFNSVAEVKDYFHWSNHNFVTRRCNHTIRCLWQKEWLIAYEEDEYDLTASINKNNRKATKIHLMDLTSNKEYDFQSYAEAERYFNLKPKSLSNKAYLKGESFIFNKQFKITVLN